MFPAERLQMAHRLKEGVRSASTLRRATSDSFPPIVMPRVTREATDAQLVEQEIRS